MGLITSIFKQRKPRQFNLKPRYYDEHKERLQQSEDRVRKELEMELENKRKHSYEDAIRGKFKGAIEDSREKKNHKVKIGIMISAIIAIVYIIFNYV